MFRTGDDRISDNGWFRVKRLNLDMNTIQSGQLTRWDSSKTCGWENQRVQLMLLEYGIDAPRRSEIFVKGKSSEVGIVKAFGCFGLDQSEIGVLAVWPQLANLLSF